jgi:hypothetical protein
MMLRWRSRALAVTLIAFIVLGTTGSGHAADYRTPALGHDHHGAYTQVCPPTDRASSDQCAVCHWLQSLRFDPGAVVLVSFGAVVTERAPQVATVPVLPTLTVRIPARAPPA